jgi:hypothetical protein
MTTINRWRRFLNNPYLLAVLLATAATWDLVLIGLACDLSKSDWATWIGSIGTVATLIGTIWLATSTERQRRREKHDLAIVAASDLLLRFHNMSYALVTAKSLLPGMLSANDDPRLALTETMKVIDDVGIWTREELLPLVAIGNDAAARFAWTTAKLRSTIVSLKRSVDAGKLDFLTLPFHDRLSDQLQARADEIENRIDELYAYLDTQGFGPRGSLGRR